MSQLIDIFNHIFLLYFFFLTALPKVFNFLLFYPTGIFFALSILYFLCFILIVVGKLLKPILHYYNCLEFLSQVPISCLPIVYIFNFITDLILNYSDYFFVFKLKYIQFVIYWVFIVLIFF